MLFIISYHDNCNYFKIKNGRKSKNVSLPGKQLIVHEPLYLHNFFFTNKE